MSLTYTSLTDRLKEWQEDTESEFETALPHIVNLAEMRISRELNVDAMRAEATGSLTPGSTDLTKPTGAITVRLISINNSGTNYDPIEMRRSDFLKEYLRDFTATGTPRFWGWEDDSTILIVPPPASNLDYKCEYEARIDGLSASTPTTWLSTDAHDLLFYACLLESGVFEKGSEDEQRFMGLYDRCLEAVRAEVMRTRTDANNLNRTA